jgi:5'-nucleotidase
MTHERTAARAEDAHTGLPDVPAYAVSGTPVTAYALRWKSLFRARDRGLRHQSRPNLGTDVLYSGTVAAAHEAALLGYQAVAVRAFPTGGACRNRRARCGQRVEYLSKHPLQFGMVLNVNVPAVPFEALRGVRSRRFPSNSTSSICRARGPVWRKYYWAPRGCTTCSDGMDVDDRWAREGM